jgi:hypothetical protein
LRTAALGGLAFALLYLLHRLLQGAGPGSSTAAAVAAYNVEHRGSLLAGEVAVGITSAVFLAIGFVSNAAETTLIGVADSNQPAAVLALDQLKGRTPAVFLLGSVLSVLGRTPEGNGSLIRVGPVRCLDAGAQRRPRRAASRSTAPG